MKTVLRPVVRKMRSLSGKPGRPSNSAEAVSARWRELSSGLVSAEHFERAGLDDIWERNPPKLDRQIIVMQSLRNAVSAGLGGIVAEFGCFRGHTAIQMVHTLRALDDDSRVLLFDSFQGMPPSDRPEDRYWSEGAMTADRAEVEARFEEYDNVDVIPGFFRDTLPTVGDVTIKLAHIDCDMRCSLRDIHDWILDRVEIGGIIVYDDYGFESCYGLKEAVDEDMAARTDYIKYSLPTGQYLAIRAR